VRRRRVLWGGLGVVAAAAGVGTALWRSRDEPDTSRLWSLRFPRPGGGELVLAEMHGKPLLLNFWATWCAPCVTEMPLLDRFYSEHRATGWSVVGLAVDQEVPVREFVGQRSIGFPIGLAGTDGLELARALGNSQGGLPFSVAFDAAGRPKARKLGALDQKTLAAWAEGGG